MPSDDFEAAKARLSEALRQRLEAMLAEKQAASEERIRWLDEQAEWVKGVEAKLEEAKRKSGRA